MRITLSWNGFDINGFIGKEVKTCHEYCGRHVNEQSIADWIRNHSVTL
ncbi:MAG: hypothetical protein ACUZ8O_08370 [Candidatus Anammoxibacter sp.]